MWRSVNKNNPQRCEICYWGLGMFRSPDLIMLQLRLTTSVPALLKALIRLFHVRLPLSSHSIAFQSRFCIPDHQRIVQMRCDLTGSRRISTRDQPLSTAYNILIDSQMVCISHIIPLLPEPAIYEPCPSLIHDIFNCLFTVSHYPVFPVKKR